MRTTVAAAGILFALAGCGGRAGAGATGGGAGAAVATGASGGASGGSGQNGRGGASGGSASGGSTGALPACAITAQPDDPKGTTISSLSGTCNTIVVTANGVVGELVGGTDGSIVLDGGATVTPAGGTIQDGDYDLVRWQNTGGAGLSYRTLRVFAGGAYIEWNFHHMNTSYDGGFQNLTFNTNATITGATMTYTYPCGGDVGIPKFEYTVQGNDLLLFDTRGPGGSVDSVDTYQRTCWR